MLLLMMVGAVVAVGSGVALGCLFSVRGINPTPPHTPPLTHTQVNNHTIKLSLNKDVKWTKALKFMLADLKVALQVGVGVDPCPNSGSGSACHAIIYFLPEKE